VNWCGRLSKLVCCRQVERLGKTIGPLYQRVVKTHPVRPSFTELQIHRPDRIEGTLLIRKCNSPEMQIA
jgi:hypothetical protein